MTGSSSHSTTAVVLEVILKDTFGGGTDGALCVYVCVCVCVCMFVLVCGVCGCAHLCKLYYVESPFPIQNFT